jgi:hypothetical protein
MTFASVLSSVAFASFFHKFKLVTGGLINSSTVCRYVI